MVYYTRRRCGLISDEGLGLLHIYYGEGVGKTTRAVGLAVRAAGEGLKVNFVQFMKSGNSGEARLLNSLNNVKYSCPGHHPFILSRGPDKVHFEHAKRALGYAYEAVNSDFQLLICDEILNTLIFGLLTKKDLLDLVQICRGRIELVMTGRDAFEELIKLADYVTEFVLRKHPYYRGAKARKGIEF